MKQIARRNFLLSSLKIGAVLPLISLPSTLFGAEKEENITNLYQPGATPDRVILTVTADPSTSVTVNWRTADAVAESNIEYSLDDAHPAFVSKVMRLKAQTRSFSFETIKAKNHSITLSGLLPGKLYTYRVGAENNWSEWMQFRTAEQNTDQAKISFIYLGDAQVGIRPLWSRVIRKAYAANPEASLVIHTGDLVNRANKDDEWGDWFGAGAYIHGTVPVMVTPGNHEYTHEDGKPHLSVYWKEQFQLPHNGPQDPLLAGSCYFTDLQGVRFISLNTQMLEEAPSQDCIRQQVEWLHKVLKDNHQQWTCIVMHHPVFSTKKGRYNKQVRKYLKPIFEQYRVDLVMQGHDHAYARGMEKIGLTGSAAGKSGTMYVVSVSGSKMYETEAMDWADIIAPDVQVYHKVSIDNETLSFNAYLTTGELLDAFELVKRKGQPNQLISKKLN